MIKYRVLWNGDMYYPEDMKELDVLFLLKQDGTITAFPTAMDKRYDPIDYENAKVSVSLKYKDRTQQEIYEGDIITNDYLESVDGTPIVVYGVEDIEKVLDGRGISERLADLMRWRIIGNIWENKDLIHEGECK